jgi:hypothetical protein
MSSDRRKQRFIGGVGGLVLALAALVILWAAGVVGIAVPGQERARPSGELMQGTKLIGQDAQVKLLTWRGAWSHVEVGFLKNVRRIQTRGHTPVETEADHLAQPVAVVREQLLPGAGCGTRRNVRECADPWENSSGRTPRSGRRHRV